MRLVRSTMRPSTRVTATGALAALALMSTLTACGSGDQQSAADSTPGAADTTSTSAAVDPSPSSSLASEEPQQLDGGGEIAPADFVRLLKAGLAKTQQAHIEFSMDGSGSQFSGAGDTDYTVTPPNMQMSMTVGAQTLGVVLVDRVMYIQNPTAGGKYLSYDLDDPNNPLGSQLGAQLDPASSIEKFVEAVQTVSSAGNEDVGGQQLARYDLVIDTTKLSDQASAAGLPAQMKATIWLDGEGRMAKTSMDMGAITYVATLSDFDKPVEIKAPPKDQIMTTPSASPSSGAGY